jgi:hypothetical protein
MPILKEEGPNDMLFQQDRSPPHFDKEVMELVSFQRNGLTGMELSLDHHICLTLLPRFFHLGVNKGYCIDATVGCHFAGLFWEDRAAVAAFTFNLCSNMWTEIEDSCDVCRTTHRALIEHL